jgi:hypothetical protein
MLLRARVNTDAKALPDVPKRIEHRIEAEPRAVLLGLIEA